MAKAYLITGFSNWGKTSLLRLLVKGSASTLFKCGETSTIKINTTQYGIQQNSNDDGTITNLCNKVQFRINHGQDNLIIAFCPTSENNNDSRELLNLLTKEKYGIEIIFLVERWDGHASLNLSMIKTFYQSFKGITYHTINNSSDIAAARSIIK